MKLATLFTLACLGTAALAQQATPPPKNELLKGFGGTALDKTPRANTSPPAAAGGNASGSSLDQRPAGAKYAPPAAAPSNLSSLAFQGLNFEAKMVTSGGKAKIDRAGGGTSVAKTVSRESSPVIELQVRNVSKSAGDAHFDWFFVAKGVSGGSPFVWDKGERDVSLPPAGAQVETIESSPIIRTTTTKTREEMVTTPGVVRTSPYGPTGSTQPTRVATAVTSQERSGAQPYGWIVRMSVDGKVVKVQASSNSLELVGRDSAQLEKLLQKKPPVH